MTDRQIASLESVDRTRLTVTGADDGLTFHIGGVGRTITISDDEAEELAHRILDRNTATTQTGNP